MEFENLGVLSLDALRELASTARTALRAALENETPTPDQLTEAEALAAGIAAVDAELASRTERTERAAALRTQFGSEPETPTAENQAVVEEEPEAAVEPEEPEAAVEEEVPAEESSTEASGNQVARLANRSTRPVTPANAPQAPRVTMRAASDVPGIATGGTVDSMDRLAELMLAKMSSYSAPNGNGESEDLRYFGLAEISKNLPHDLTLADRHTEDDMNTVLQRAVDEHRLPQQSLVASGGWCAPSEVVYDLCDGETTDGILSLPEIGLGRGGLKYTMGPDWSDIYSNVGFAQTEAQAISGTTKTCYEVPCPTWQEVRLDAVGLCIKAPILTEAAYPELIKRWLSGSLVAHQHKKNVRRLAAISTALGSAQASYADFGATTISLFNTIDLIAAREKQVRKWAINQALEIVLPHWTLALLRADYSARNAMNPALVTDQMIMGEFTKRKYAPQFVYGWQELASNAYKYPNTFDVMIYKAGTFVEGTSNVIKLQSVYDAASLATNIYTALFFEEGQAILKMCYGGLRATISTCIAGATGAQSVAVCGNVGP